MGTLTKEQREKFERLIKNNLDIFAKNKKDLGKTTKVKHTIDTGNEKPIKQRFRRFSHKEKETIRKEIETMLENGIIRKSKSPQASPIVLVKKKDGSTRFCIDFRKLNKITKKDNHPLPRIDDMLDKFQGSQWFSSIDLASGYWQVEMDEDDREKTAFIIEEGLYEFNVMPFGLCNAPATFQRLMHEILGDLIYTKAPVYIDDINIHSVTFEQHLKDLEEVFDKIRKAGMKLKLEKCHFCFPEITFLGFVVGKDGIKTDKEKVEKVINFPKPTTITELRGFLGLASYYRRFIKDFSKMSKPLTKLMQGIKYEKGKKQKDQNKKISITENWGKEQEENFNRLKQVLTEAPVLVYPDFEKEFILQTDASKGALGAVLSQVDENGKDHPVAFASRTCNKSEQNYSTTELESLAVVWAVEKFHNYLYGQKFIIETDHNALKFMDNTDLTGRRARWQIRMMPYDYEIKYKPGRIHKNADALSRMKDYQKQILEKYKRLQE